MVTHVKVVAVLYIALSALALLVALMMSLAFGLAGGIVASNADAHDARIALPIIGLAGSMLVIFMVVLALPGLVAGIGLLKFRPWARILGIMVAVLSLIHIPIGTVVGIYALWVLFNKETEALFQATPPTAPA